MSEIKRCDICGDVGYHDCSSNLTAERVLTAILSNACQDEKDIDGNMVVTLDLHCLLAEIHFKLKQDPKYLVAYEITQFFLINK